MSAPTHISIPERLSAAERTRDSLVTALMWGVYVYLWVPLASLVAWLAGFEIAYDVMVREGGAQALAELLQWYGLSVAVIFVVVTAWSLWNRIRYRHKGRRRAVVPVPDADIARYFGIDDATLQRYRAGDTLTVDVDTDGGPVLLGSVPRDACAAEPSAPRAATG